MQLAHLKLTCQKIKFPCWCWVLGRQGAESSCCNEASVVIDWTHSRIQQAWWIRPRRKLGARLKFVVGEDYRIWKWKGLVFKWKHCIWLSLSLSLPSGNLKKMEMVIISVREWKKFVLLSKCLTEILFKTKILGNSLIFK